MVLKYLKMGIIELEHIVDHDMWCLGRLYLRARKPGDEIERLVQVSKVRRYRLAEVLV